MAFTSYQCIAQLLVTELPHLELFHLFAYILLLYTVIKKKKRLHFRKKPRILFRHKNRLIAMTVRGEEEEAILTDLYYELQCSSAKNLSMS